MLIPLVIEDVIHIIVEDVYTVRGYKTTVWCW